MKLSFGRTSQKVVSVTTNLSVRIKFAVGTYCYGRKLMFKLIILEDGKERELENEFNSEIEAEIYGESLEVEGYRVVPI